MNAIILSVGHELTSGATVDTNSAYLAGELCRRGLCVIEHVTVGDDRRAIRDAMVRSAAAAEVVLVTGGLGPTLDDVTREALADALGCTLELDAECLRQIEAFFARRKYPMVESNRVQAMVPAAARAIPNDIGTAPGLAAKLGRADVYIMPGVPSEMRKMFADRVAPLLPAGEGVILQKVLHTFGEGESTVGEKIADLMRRGENPSVGTTVSSGIVSVRILAHEPTQATAERSVNEMAVKVRQRLGGIVFGEDGDTMASVIGELLRRGRQTLSTAESCTGGLVGELITGVPGSSDYYLGGVVAYSNDVKQSILGVPAELLQQHGAVSEEVAGAMAMLCREKFRSDYAISVTGIAGPGGGTAEKPVGFVYTALAGPDGATVRRHIFPGSRDIVRLRSAAAAMNFLWRKLKENSHA